MVSIGLGGGVVDCEFVRCRLTITLFLLAGLATPTQTKFLKNTVQGHTLRCCYALVLCAYS